jgi:hypothetical protein
LKGEPIPEVSAGIRRCQIWGEQARLPPIAGMILVSGVFDIIKQLRYEAKLGVEDRTSVSALAPETNPLTRRRPFPSLSSATRLRSLDGRHSPQLVCTFLSPLTSSESFLH